MDVATGSRRIRAVAAWALANLVIGYLAAYPLLMAVVFAYYVRATLWGSVASPFRDGEAGVPLFLIVFSGVPLAIAAVLINRRLLRRLRLWRWRAVAYWMVTLAVLLAPFAYFALAGTTVSQMLGKGIIW